MKYYLLLSLGIIFSFNSFSQKKWGFGAEFFPNYSIISKNYTNNWAYDGGSRGEFKTSFSLRTLITKKTHKLVSVYFGLGLQFTGEKVYRDLHYFDQFWSDTGYHNITNLQFTTGINIHILKRLYVQNSVNVNLNSGNSFSDGNMKYDGKYGNWNYPVLINKTPFSYSYQVGIGYNLILKEKFRLYLQPSCEFFIRNNRKQTKRDYLPKIYGIVLGAGF